MGCVVDSHAQSRFVPENDRFFFAVSDDCDVRSLFDNLPRDELHGLEVSLRARRLQARALEQVSDVPCGSTMTFASGFPPSELVASQKLDVFPPHFSGLGFFAPR